jgi:hypothetical protein
MPRLKSSLTKPSSDASWANLLQAEVATRETKFPPGSKTYEEIRAMMKKSGLPHCKKYIDTFLTKSNRAGTIKTVRGVVLNENGWLIRAQRYVVNPT